MYSALTVTHPKAQQHYVQLLGHRIQTSRTRRVSARRQRAEYDKPYFCQTYFPQNVRYAFSPYHLDVLRLCDIKNQIVLISAFRHWGKSTLASYMDWFHKACYGLIHVSGFGSNNQTLARQFTQAIKTFLEDPPPEAEVFREDFPEMIGGVIGTQTNFTTLHGVKVFAIGAGMTPRGFIDLRKAERIDFFCCDDLETDFSAASQMTSEKMYQWLSKAVYPAMRSPEMGGFYLRFIGNPISPVAVMTRMMKDPAKYPHRVVIPIQDDDGIPTWPDVFGLDAIMKIRQDVTLSAWHSEYLLKPISSDTQIFREAWLSHWEQSPPLSAFDRIVAASDPSTTSTSSSDYKAIIVAGHHAHENRIYILHVVCARLTVMEYFAKLHEMQTYYGGELVVEDNGVKDFLPTIQTSYERDHGCHLRMRYVTHTGSKAGRIQGALESLFERDQIRLPPLSHSDTRLFIDQLLAFPNGVHDDAIDAAAEAVVSLSQPYHLPTTTGQTRTFSASPVTVPRYF